MRRLITTAIAVLATLAAPSSSYAQAREGVVVHGHWTIEIRNPDGSLAGRHEFENALTGGGKFVVASGLGRTRQVVYWAVRAGDTQFCGSGGSFVCVMVEPGSRVVNVLQPSQTLSVNVVTGLSPELRLAGSFTATADGTISQVASMTALCETTTDDPYLPRCGTAGEAGPYFDFSERTLPSSIPVQAGQIVQVTVTFSFS